MQNKAVGNLACTVDESFVNEGKTIDETEEKSEAIMSIDSISKVEKEEDEKTISNNIKLEDTEKTIKCCANATFELDDSDKNSTTMSIVADQRVKYSNKNNTNNEEEVTNSKPEVLEKPGELVVVWYV